jgi:tape measure domain-containing protein
MADKLTLGEMIWQIKADSTDFDKQLTKSQKGMLAFGQGATAAGKKLSLGLTLPLVALGGIAIKNAADFETQRVAFGTLLKDVDKGNKLFKTLKEFSAETPLALGDITKSSQRLLAVGIAMDKQVEVLRQLGDLALGDAQKLDTLTNAYSKLKTKGRASLEEINMFTEAGIPLMDTLAETLGVTTEETFKLISAGKVGFPEVQAALDSLTGAGGTFNNAMKNASETTAGKFSTALDNAKIASAEFGKILLPVASDILDRITGLAQSFAELDDSTKQVIIRIALLAASIGPLLLIVGKSVKAFQDGKKAITLFNSAMGKVPTKAKLAAGAIGLVVIAVVALASAIKKAEIEDFNNRLRSLRFGFAGLIDDTEELAEFYKDGFGLKQINELTKKYTLTLKDLRVQLDKNNQITDVWDVTVEGQIKNLERAQRLLDESVTSSEERTKATDNEVTELWKLISARRLQLFDQAQNLKLSDQEAENFVRRDKAIQDLTDKLTVLTDKNIQEGLVRENLIAQREKYAEAIESELRLFKQIEDGLDVIATKEKFFGSETDANAEKLELFNSLLLQAANEGLPLTSDAVEYLREQIELLSKETAKSITTLEKMKIASQIIGAVGDIASSIATAVENANQREIDALDRKIAKYEEVNEAVDNNAQHQIEALQGALEVAIVEGRKEEEENIRRALADHQREQDKLAQEKAFAKERERLEKEGAKRAYALNLVAWTLGLSVIGLNTAIAVSEALRVPPAPNFPLAIATGFVGAAQLASAVANKPKKPQFAEGVFAIPNDTDAFVHAGETIIPKTFTESINDGEAALVNPKAVNNGGDRPINIYLGNELIYSGIHKETQNGNILIDKGSIV